MAPLSPSRPLIYASMGTLQNGVERVFQVIAEACAGLDAQLVLSLGTGFENLAPLAGNPIVVGYAPQLELLRRSALTITHGGLNTVLESLSVGVPLVVIPVTNDQPRGRCSSRMDWHRQGHSGAARKCAESQACDPPRARSSCLRRSGSLLTDSHRGW
jgi:zeaxanthin glucosyltransferase